MVDDKKRKISDLPRLPTDGSEGDRSNIWFGVDNMNNTTSYYMPLQDVIDLAVQAMEDKTSKPRRSEFLAIVDIPPGTPINMNAATLVYTQAIGLDYTSHDAGTNATFDDLYGRDLICYANGQMVQQPDISRNDADPAGYVRFGVNVAANSVIVFESQVSEVE